MADQVRVFVSHHHSPEEDAFTARLVADLETAGADVWVDTAGITSDDFVKKISEGLAGRHWLVLVMTPEALKSPWVQREVNVALSEHTAGRMLGIVPIMMHPCKEQDIPMLWRTLHRYDATRDYASARDGLLGALGLWMPTTHQPQPAPDILLPRLAQLGFHAYRSDDRKYIVPPMCDVPAGLFLMGSDPSKDKVAREDEQPQHSVTLAAYQIGKYPVTVAEYECFVYATGRTTPTGQDGALYEIGWQTQVRERLDHPVVMVNWRDASDYAAWLTVITGQTWRLPSEAEWEKAARGADGRIYPWGDTFDAIRCNTKEGGKGTTTPVGSYPTGASPYGALDMSGNVWEWTSSILKPYTSNSTTGHEQTESAEKRVIRGASWFFNASGAHTAFRADFRSDLVSSGRGFRLARSVPNS